MNHFPGKNRRGVVPLFVWVAIAISILLLAGAKSFELVTSPVMEIFTGTSGLGIAIVVVLIVFGTIYLKTRLEK